VIDWSYRCPVAWHIKSIVYHNFIYRFHVCSPKGHYFCHKYFSLFLWRWSVGLPAKTSCPVF